MAKKKESLTEMYMTAMREAIDRVADGKRCSERAYCEAVSEACDGIKMGVDIRLQELAEDEELANECDEE